VKLIPSKNTLKYYAKRSFGYLGFNIAPSIFILGTQKAATSSLHTYLTEHSQIQSGLVKEVRYFNVDANYKKRLSWYTSQFPRVNTRMNIRTIDATPEYLYYPWIAQRIKDYNPNSKCIIILRNPIDRAYSSWNMHRQIAMKKDNFYKIFDEPYRDNYENNIKKEFYSEDGFPSFEKAVEKEFEKIEIKSDFIEPSFIRRGIYAKQIKNYYKHFPKENLLVLLYEDIKEDIDFVLNKIFIFLDLEPEKVNTSKLSQVNKRKYKEEMLPETRIILKEFYKNKNKELEELIGRKLDWK
jgi:hypothetical protein